MNFIAKKTILAGLVIATILLMPANMAQAQETPATGTPAPVTSQTTAGTGNQNQQVTGTTAVSPGTTIGSFGLQSTIGFASWLVSTVLYFVAYFFAKVIFLGGLLMNWVLELNSKITDNPAVQIGWPIVRDLANLGFVFVIIIIAFSTVLRQEGKLGKAALPRLIIAALLVNFSLLIATAFLDFAGVLTSFFISSAYFSSNGQGGISQAIAVNMHLADVVLSNPLGITGSANMASFGASVVAYVAQAMFAAAINIIGAITLISIAIMFLIRYIALGILLIMLPAAILSWVVGSGKWGEWTDDFFKYAFFGPIAGFFIYIALRSADTFASLSSGKFAVIEGDISGVVTKVASGVGAMVMMVTILLYGLSRAEKYCEYGGKATTNLVKGAFTGAGKWLGKTTSVPFTMGAADIANRLGLSRIGATSKSTTFRTLTRPFRQLGAAAKETRQNYGGLKDIPSAMFEEMTGGFGVKSRKFRLGEEKQFRTEGKEIERLAKKMIFFDSSKASDEAYMNKYKADIQNAQKEITSYLNREGGGDLEKTTKEFEKRSLIKQLANRARVGEKEVSEFIEKNAGDLENAKKYYERESDIKNLMEQTAATRTEVEEALKKTFNNLKDTKADLLKNKKSTKGETFQGGAGI